MKQTWYGAEDRRFRTVGRLVVTAIVAGGLTASIGAGVLQRRARRALIAEAALRNEDAAVRQAALLDDRLQRVVSKLGLIASRREVAAVGSGLQSELAVALKDSPELERLVAHDASGRPLAAVSPFALLDPGALAGRLDLVQATQTTLDFSTRLLRGPPPTVEVAVPIDNPPGTRVGVLVGTALLEELVAQSPSPFVDSAATALVVDDQGWVLVHPQRERPVRAERIGMSPPHGRPSRKTIVQDGETLLVASAPAGALPVWVVVHEPAAAAVAPASGAVGELTVILVLVVIVTVVAVSAVGGYLLRPLRLLADAANRLGRGEHVRVPERGEDDVGLLAREFNRMADALEQRMTELREHRESEERLRRDTRVAETLHRVATALTAKLEPADVIQAVTDTATALTGAEMGVFFHETLDEDGATSMSYALSGVSRDAFAGFPAPGSCTLLGATLNDQKPVRVDDLLRDDRHRELPTGHPPVRSYLGVPVSSPSGTRFGGMFFGHSLAGMFTELHERIALGIAAQAAVALDNARLYGLERLARAAAEEANRHLSVLAEASRVLGSSLDVDAVLHALGALLVPAVADTCAIDVVRDGALGRVVTVVDHEAWGVDEVPASATPDASDIRDPVVRAIRTRTTQRLGDPGPTTGVVAPLVARSEVFGAMSLRTAASGGRVLRPADVPLIEELARRAAFAVENARLFAAQRGVAETLQRSLLPERFPPTPGLEMAARYLPGGPDVEVGGDWYDVIELPGGVLGIAMGDVVGRGIRAAAVMGQIRNAVRAYALDGHGPAELLRRVNALQQGYGTDHLATMLYCELALDTGTLRLASAGHPPPLLVTPEGDARYLEGGRGVPLGAAPHASFDQALVTVEPASTLVLYTDGLVERRTVPLDEGLERLRLAAADGPEDLEQLTDHIIERLLAGEDAGDDVAVLLLRLAPVGKRLRLRVPARASALGPARAAMRRWLVAMGAHGDEAAEILVACGEACANAIIHGSASAADEFSLEAELDGDVRITVRDAGQWREERPSDGGRGLGLMRALMDAVEVLPGPQGTEVRMRRRLSPRRERRAR